MNYTRAIMASILLSVPAIAGPPLICHPFSIGNETSLPQGSHTKDWNNPDLKYDTRMLTSDTLKLLDSGKPVLTRMETLRRAAVYASRNQQAGLELASQLMARAVSSELKGQSDGLALFDAGYFVESLKQIAHISKANPFPGVNGYEWVKRSLPGIKDKVSAEFALGLMKTDSPWPNEHIRRAVAGAQEGTLLAENIVDQFQEPSLAAVKRKVLVTSAAR